MPNIAYSGVWKYEITYRDMSNGNRRTTMVTAHDFNEAANKGWEFCDDHEDIIKIEKEWE